MVSAERLINEARGWNASSMVIDPSSFRDTSTKISLDKSLIQYAIYASFLFYRRNANTDKGTDSSLFMSNHT